MIDVKEWDRGRDLGYTGSSLNDVTILFIFLIPSSLRSDLESLLANLVFCRHKIINPPSFQARPWHYLWTTPKVNNFFNKELPKIKFCWDIRISSQNVTFSIFIHFNKLNIFWSLSIYGGSSVFRFEHFCWYNFKASYFWHPDGLNDLENSWKKENLISFREKMSFHPAFNALLKAILIHVFVKWFDTV